MNPWGLGVICARVRGAGGIFQGGQQALWGCVAQHTWREEQVKQELWKLILCWHKVFLAVLTWTVSQNGVCMFSFAGSFVGGSSSPFPPSLSFLPTPVSFLSPESRSEVTFSFWQWLIFLAPGPSCLRRCWFEGKNPGEGLLLRSDRKSPPGKFATEYKISGYLGRKCVLDAKFLQSRSEFEKWVDVEDRDGQVKWLRDERPGK